ncbi:MAG: VCBS repeat-containing protein, partial [Planctomycetota bacterium]
MRYDSFLRLTVAFLTLSAPLASGQSLLVEVGAPRGIEPFTRAPGLSAGLAAEDFDGDGDVDLFVPNGLGAVDQLYVNDGSGRFTESAASLGLAHRGNHRAGLWFDADGDGDLDLATVGDCYESVPCTGESSVRLHRQRADGTFEEMTGAAGLTGDLNLRPDTHVGGIAAGDVDGDGDLDLLVVFWEGFAHLFMNDGTGRFTDESGPRGLRLEQNHWQPVMFDFSGDGHLDIFQAVDFTANRFWVNQGDATFLDEAPALGMDNAFNEMGVHLGDPDRDGDLDLYVTNIFTPFGRRNLFYARGPAPMQFTEMSAALGIDDSGCGWGTSFADL